jgi:GT2 family glycosyltransferase
MNKLTIIQVVYNNKRFIEPVFKSIFAQTFKDFKVVAVISGNEDGGKELLQSMFPQVEIIDPKYNIGFAKGHNLVFEKEESEFYQLVNPDLILEPDYLEKMLEAFKDSKVGGATGKLYKVASEKLQVKSEEFNVNKQNYKTLDSTGVVISKSGRGRDRGQHEEDTGQYDAQKNVQAVSAAGAMYRRVALESVKLAATSYQLQASGEYFDEDFHSYWEDVDLSWRMANAGWKNVFVPQAIGFHGRGAGSSKKGYLHVIDFVKHHRALPQRIRELNYKNHIFMYVKNSKWFYPQFFFREFFMLVYIVLFETSTLKILPEFFKTLPKMWKKRQVIKKAAHKD